MSAASKFRRTPRNDHVAATRYKLGDSGPTVKSRGRRKSWKSINGDLPKNEISRRRARPIRPPGECLRGTETGIHFASTTGPTGRHAGGPDQRDRSTT